MTEGDYLLSGKVIPTGDDMKEQARLARIGQWWEDVFRCRFQNGNLPRPGTALLGSRLRIQIDMPHGDWEDWHE